MGSAITASSSKISVFFLMYSLIDPLSRNFIVNSFFLRLSLFAQVFFWNCPDKQSLDPQGLRVARCRPPKRSSLEPCPSAIRTWHNRRRQFLGPALHYSFSYQDHPTLDFPAWVVRTVQGYDRHCLTLCHRASLLGTS